MTIEIPLLISFASVVIAAIVCFTNISRNKAADDRKEASDMTTVIVKLETIGNDVRDVKSDIRNIKTDVQDLNGRLIIAEQSVKSAHHRIDAIENSLNNPGE